MDAIKQFAADAAPSFPVAIVDDWRFVNEFEVLEEDPSFAVIPVRISLYDPEGKEVVKTGTHNSDVDLDQFHLDVLSEIRFTRILGAQRDVFFKSATNVRSLERFGLIVAHLSSAHSLDGLGVSNDETELKD